MVAWQSFGPNTLVRELVLSKISNSWPDRLTGRYDLPAPNHTTREKNVGGTPLRVDRLMATRVQSTSSKRKRGALRKLLILGASIGIGREAADLGIALMERSVLPLEFKEE